MAIVWTKYWGGADDGTVLGGIDLRNIQDDLANVVEQSDIGPGGLVQGYDDDLENLSSPENISTLNLVVNGAFDVFASAPTPDHWVVEGGGTEAQESTNVRIGEYSYSITSDTDGSASRQTVYDTISATENSYWRGREVTMAALIYCTDINHGRIQIDDGVASTNSDYHTGTAGWELIKVTHTMSLSATKLDVVLKADRDTKIALFDGVRLNHGGSTWQYSRNQRDNFAVSSFDQILLNERLLAPQTNVNQGALYTKEVAGQTELFFREESDGDEIQLTSGGWLNGDAIQGSEQASFLVRCTGSGTFDETGGYDIGSNFDSNTFTAPVDGKYLMTYSMRFSGGGNTNYCASVTLSSSSGSATGYCGFSGIGTATIYQTATATKVFDLSASDTVTASLNTSAGSGTTTAMNPTYNNITYGHWSGILIA